MEQELSKQAQEIESRQAPNNSSVASKQIWGLTAEENKVAALKRASPSFGVMAPADLLVHAQASMLRVCVITGWQMPEDELQDVLMDQFMKKLVETYPNINPEEFEYAFRKYGGSVQDWGKQINLGLIHQVMHPYLIDRANISKVEETALAREAEKGKVPTEDLSDKAMLDWAAEIKNRINTQGYTVKLIPIMLYDWLVKSERLFRGKGEKKEYMQKAFVYIRMDLITALEKKEDKEMRARLNEFNDMKERNVFKSNEIENIRTLAKKMIAYDFLKDEFNV